MKTGKLIKKWLAAKRETTKQEPPENKRFFNRMLRGASHQDRRALRQRLLQEIEP